MKPGVSFADILRRYTANVEAAGFEGGAALLHGRGLGEDRPLMWGHRPVEDESLRLEEGMVFILKPAAFPKGTRDYTLREGETVEMAVRAGDTVAITGSGALRLGKRPLKLVEL
jgi:Xaa-Pro aminopeptidase